MTERKNSEQERAKKKAKEKTSTRQIAKENIAKNKMSII